MTASDLVTLKGGFVVPVEVLRRMWQLEDRGVRFLLDHDDDDRLLAGPRELLTDEDRRFIREHRELVTAVTAYCAEVCA